MRLWDYVEALCKKTYQGHENKKYSIGGSFGVNGKDAFIASGSEDGCIILWDVNSKNVLQKIEAHDGVTFWVDTHPFLDTIVSCGEDKLVKIWINEDEEEHEEHVNEGDMGQNNKQVSDEAENASDRQDIKQNSEDTPMNDAPPDQVDEIDL